MIARRKAVLSHMLPQINTTSIVCSLIPALSSFLHSAITQSITALIVSVFLLTTSASACPLSCECSDVSVLEVSCKNGRLLNIFTHIDNTTYSLSLDHVVDLRLIKKSHVQDLKASEIVRLQITSSFVKEIEESAFSELIHLEYLDLSGNELAVIYNNSFAGLNGLRSLNISHNELSALGESIKPLHHLVTLDLSVNYLKDLPVGVFSSQKSLTFLKLDGNPLKTLRNGIFDGLAGVRELHARDCSLVLIEDDVFSQMPELSVIDLGENRLTAVPSSSVLSKFNILRIVYLDHNEINALHKQIFEGVHLHLLDISYNRINKIDPLAFDKSALGNLDLSYNSIISLNGEALQPLGKTLTHLNLAGNPLHQLQPDAFGSLELLETLNLSSCSLDSLENDHIQKLPLLHELDISHNNLHVLSQPVLDSFEKLSVIHLHENAWVCDCQIIYFRDWLSLTSTPSKVQCPPSHEDQINCTSLHCSLPSHLQSRTITQLKDEELGQCQTVKSANLPAGAQGAIVATCLVFAFVLLIIAIVLWRKGNTHQSLKRACVPSAAESSHVVDEDTKVSPLANCDRHSLTLSDHNFVFRHYFDHLVTDPKLMADGDENLDDEDEPTTHKERDSLYSSQPSLYSHHSDAGYGMESTV